MWKLPYLLLPAPIYKPKSPQVQCVNLAMSFLFLPLDDNPSFKRSLLQISASLGHYFGDCNIKALHAFYGGMGKFTHPPIQDSFDKSNTMFVEIDCKIENCDHNRIKLLWFFLPPFVPHWGIESKSTLCNSNKSLRVAGEREYSHCHFEAEIE